MTAEPELPPITCPSSLIASCAPLLGFEPRDCVVGFILGVPGRISPVLVRADLGVGTDDRSRARDLAESIAGTGGGAVDLVAWIEAPDHVNRATLPSAPILAYLAECLEWLGIEVPGCLSTNGRVFWVHDCPDDLCCGGPRPLDGAVVTAVQAEYVYAGFAPLASREELARRLDRDQGRASWVSRRIVPARQLANLERWRDGQISFLSDLLVPGRPSRASAGGRARWAGAPLDVVVAARALRGLADVTVRDTVLQRLIRSDVTAPEQWRETVHLMCDLVRCAPERHVAPAATLLSVVAWMRGEGSLANLALDRAEDDNPRYRLAGLSRQVISRGVDPRIWRETMAGLTEAEIRRAGRSAAVDGAPGGGAGRGAGSEGAEGAGSTDGESFGAGAAGSAGFAGSQSGSAADLGAGGGDGVDAPARGAGRDDRAKGAGQAGAAGDPAGA
jgi:hypothetical protein